jgi:hypothetical protein
VDFPVFARTRGAAVGRFRRELRRRMLEPVVLGSRSMRAAEPLTALASCDGITDILVF